MKFTPEKRCPLNPMLLLNSMLIEIGIENGNQIVKYCDLDNLMIIIMKINSSEPYFFTSTHFSVTVESFLATNMKPFCRLFVVSDVTADKERRRLGQEHTSVDWYT